MNFLLNAEPSLTEEKNGAAKSGNENVSFAYDALSEDEKKKVLSLLSRGMLSEDEKRQLWQACAQSRLNEEEEKRIKRAFVLSGMTDEQRRELIAKRRQKSAEQPQAEKKAPAVEEAPLKKEEAQNAAARISFEGIADPISAGNGFSGEVGFNKGTREVRHGAAPAGENAPEKTQDAEQVSASSGNGAQGGTVLGRRMADAAAQNNDADVRDAGEKRNPVHVNKRKSEKKLVEEEEPEETDGSAVTSLLKGIVYIVAVIVISVFASWAIISVGNDVFAFVKDDAVVTVVIEEDMTIPDVASLLYENGVIRYPTIYELYIRLKKYSTNYLVGEYNISPSMNYKQLNRAFTHIETTKEQVVVTIPEGYTIDQMIDLFLSYGIGTREGFVDAINNFVYEDYRFLDELPESDPERRYRMEGYLFPDTYYFFKDDAEVAVVDKLLTNFDRKITDAYYERAQQLGMTMDEVITLASMIQAEGTTLSDYENISSVFHNRLDHPKQYPKMQSDATLQYILDKRKAALTASDLKIDSKYNSYLYDGLPPSAICNPSLDAIECALYPAETAFYYFIADSHGKTYFSETLEQHEALKNEFSKEEQ